MEHDELCKILSRIQSRACIRISWIDAQSSKDVTFVTFKKPTLVYYSRLVVMIATQLTQSPELVLSFVAIIFTVRSADRC